MAVSTKVLQALGDRLNREGFPVSAQNVFDAIEEIERLRAQNVGENEGRELAALDAEATQGEWIAHREGFITPKGDNRMGVAIADGIGNPKNWPANRAFILALVADYRAKKRGPECGAPVAQPKILSPAQ